jgi:uncharacterized protein (DUF488 family)
MVRGPTELVESREPGASHRRPDGGLVALTLGYQGRDLKEVLGAVQSHGVQQVLDVRQNASSRKPGFSSDELRGRLSDLGVGYVHLPELGCGLAARHALWEGGATEPFRQDYLRALGERPGVFDGLLRRVRSARSLVLCLERDPRRCHRGVLAEMLRSRGIRVVEL